MKRLFMASILSVFTAAAIAQTSPATPTTSTSTSATATATAAPNSEPAEQVREELESILRNQPSQVARILRLDPTLLTNDSYMATYPALATFARQHPEIQHNPSYFFGMGYDDTSGRIAVGDIAGFLVFVVITSVIVWIIRLVVEQRRWSRLAAIQTDMHSKLLDRFSSNEELLGYLQSSAGRKFLEATPIPLESGPRPVSAPVARILWSLQLGFVLIAAGIGFDLVSLRVTGSDSNVLYGLGVISLLVGVALTLSAGIFYLLSRRFGLLQQSVTESSN